MAGIVVMAGSPDAAWTFDAGAAAQLPAILLMMNRWPS